MPEPFPAALLLPADAFDTSHHQVMGRRVAGRQFALAIAAHLRDGEQLMALTMQQSDAQSLHRLMQPVLPSGASLHCVQGFQPSLIRDVGALHLPDPGLAHWAQLRPLNQSASFSFTGVIHTLCSERVLCSLQDLLLAPLHSWDALVCTSTAGRKVVEQAMNARLELVRRRFQQPGLRLPSGPLLPVIPLAIDPQQPFAPNLSRQERRQLARAQLGLPQDAFVVAFVGRLSFHSKAHPLPLYRALARLAADHPEVMLLECGHGFNTAILDAYDGLQAAFPQLRCHRIGGLEPASDLEKWHVLAAADVFTSPADNLQETFGLTLLEAMAAELPLVVSDWDGYRDLVDHGVSGLLIPTSDVLPALPQPDSTEILYRLGLIDYDTMVGIRALGVVVDDNALYTAFHTLLLNPQRRHAMGAAAKQRLEQSFSWSVVASAYRQLWQELTAVRCAASKDAPALMPLHAPYGTVFSSYASSLFGLNQVCFRDDHTPLHCLLEPMQAGFLRQVLAGSPLGLEALIEQLSILQRSGRPLPLAELQQLGLSRPQALSLLAVLVKLGVAE